MKSLHGQTSTVDQVHDAVEKVLIEMGHARTALAYVRYRDRRARIRKLREGDTKALLTEWAEARQERAAPVTLAGQALFVRTSAETLVKWDRDRIVAALVRETDLERGTASLIALEVEQTGLVLSAVVQQVPEVDPGLRMQLVQIQRVAQPEQRILFLA